MSACVCGSTRLHHVQKVEQRPNMELCIGFCESVIETLNMLLKGYVMSLFDGDVSAGMNASEVGELP